MHYQVSKRYIIKAVTVSCISEIVIANCNYLSDWTQGLSPNCNKSKIQYTECKTLINVNLKNFQASKCHFVELDFLMNHFCKIQDILSVLLLLIAINRFSLTI